MIFWGAFAILLQAPILWFIISSSLQVGMGCSANRMDTSALCLLSASQHHDCVFLVVSGNAG